MENKEKEGTLNMPQEGTVVAVVQTETEQKKEIVKKIDPINSAPAIPKELLPLQAYFVKPKKAFLASGGTEEQFSREVNFAMQAMMNNNYLIECAKSFPDHMIEAIKNVGLTGLTLNPVLSLGYLVPYKGKVKFQPSYMGKCDILIRTGVVKEIYAKLVYSTDKFSMTKGSKSELIHEPNAWATKDTRGELMGGYYYAKLTNGIEMFDTMPRERIEDIRGRSEAFKNGKTSPWSTDFEEMARKSIVNWAFKFLPKTNISDSVLKVIEASNEVDNEEFNDWIKAGKQSEKDDFDEDVQIID